MKRLIALLSIFLADIILLNFVSADEGMNLFPTPYFPYLLLFATMIATLLLFYDKHWIEAQASWAKFKTKNYPEIPKDTSLAAVEKELEGMSVVAPHEKPKGKLSLEMQYQFIDLVKQQIIEMKKSGLTEAEMVKSLRSEEWDAQVIYIALGRVKREQASS